MKVGDDLLLGVAKSFCLIAKALVIKTGLPPLICGRHEVGMTGPVRSDVDMRTQFISVRQFTADRWRITPLTNPTRQTWRAFVTGRA
jgi:hypothetical protein